MENKTIEPIHNHRFRWADESDIPTGWEVTPEIQDGKITGFGVWWADELISHDQWGLWAD